MKKLNTEKLKRTVDARINDDIDSHRVGACAVRVMQSGKTVYEFFNGADGCSVFRLASMTKPITAVAVLIQASKGIIDIYDDVSKYIPSFKDMGVGKVENGSAVFDFKAKTPIKIFHLLTHTSGLGCMDVGALQHSKISPERSLSLSSVVDFYSETLLDFEPYTMQYYSPGAAFDVLARIVELTSGKSYDRFLSDEIFTPLKMNDTTFSPSIEQWKRCVPMHDRINEKSVISPTVDGCVFESIPPSAFSGGAGLASTLDDYTSFAEMLLSCGELNGVRILPSEYVDLMSRPLLPSRIMMPPVVWGLGVRVISDGSYKALGQGCYGWSGAYGTHFWVDPQNEIVAVYMKNSRYDGGAGAVTAYNFELDVTACLE